MSEKLLRWADLVLVMESAHKRKLREDFPEVFHDLRVEVLDIPDDYEFMDPELIELIRQRVEPGLRRRQAEYRHRRLSRRMAARSAAARQKLCGMVARDAGSRERRRPRAHRRFCRNARAVEAQR